MRKSILLILLLAFSASVFAVHVTLSPQTEQESLMTLDVCSNVQGVSVDSSPTIAVQTYALPHAEAASPYVVNFGLSLGDVFVSAIYRPPIV